MGVEPENVPKRGGPSVRSQALTRDIRKKRRVSAPTDTRQCPIQSEVSFNQSAPTDTVNVSPSGQGCSILQPIATSVSSAVTRVQLSPWLSIRQGERYAHVGDGVLRAAIKRGEVPAYQRQGGKGLLVHVSDLDSWIRSWSTGEEAYA